MKFIYVSILALALTACSQSNSSQSDNKSTESSTGSPQDYSVVDKFCGKWSASDKPDEIITITKSPDFEKSHTCIVNDGKTEVVFPFEIKESIFKLRQPEYWVQILHDEKSNQLLWKTVRYDEIEGKVVRTYNFKES